MDILSAIQTVNGAIRQMVPDILTYSGVLGGVLILTDWIMGEKQKKWLKVAFEDTWLFLAQQSAGKFLTVLRRKAVQVGIAILGISLVAYGQSVLILGAIRQEMVIVNNYSLLAAETVWKAALIVAISYFVLPRLIDIFTRSGSVWWCLVKLFLVNEVVEGIYVLFKFFLVSSGILSSVSSESLIPIWHGSPIVSFLAETTIVPLEALAMQMRAVFFLSFVWVLLVLALLLLLRAMQLIVFRVATYDKGPVLAVSALITACGAILKVFA